MECTGERYMPDYDGDWTLEHVHRYLLACELAAGKDVLDIASGEGYGSHMLATVAKRVTGADIDAETVRLAKDKYCADNLEYIQANATSIPLPDNSVDVVTSFETIEHIVKHEAMLREVKRVLRPEGLLIISSPDKHEYTDLPKYYNTYHLKELYRNEFEDLLRAHFASHRIFGQRVVFGSVVGTEETTSFISWHKSAQASRTVGLAQPLYLIAVASDAPVPALPAGILQAPLTESDAVRQLQKNVEQGAITIAGLEKKWQEAQQKLYESEHHRARVEKELFAVVTSRYWKVTRPLRALARLWKWL